MQPLQSYPTCIEVALDLNFRIESTLDVGAHLLTREKTISADDEKFLLRLYVAVVVLEQAL
jgi:hypothetical protein